jgi:hypothetical protein
VVGERPQEVTELVDQCVESLERHALALVAAAVEDERACLFTKLPKQSVAEGRLSDAALPRDEHDSRLTTQALLVGGLKELELGLPPDDGTRGGGRRSASTGFQWCIAARQSLT